MHRTAIRAIVLVLGLSLALAACDFSPPGRAPAPQPPLEATESPSPADPTESEAPAPGDPTESESPTPGEPSESPPESESPTPSEPGTPQDPQEPAPEPGAPEPPGDGYELVWSDEFDGTALDTSRWTALDNTYVSYDVACITARDDNVFVQDGLLTLRAKRENYTCGSQNRDFTTAYLNTIGKASFTYGYFEIRAKSPNGPDNSRGLWPAFWGRPYDGGKGEIDIVELFGGPDYHDTANQAIHFTYEPRVKQDNLYTFESGHPSDGFHTYATEWTEDELRWYIDGELVWQRDRSTTPWFVEAFNRDYNLRLNFQVGGWLGDPDAATAFPADFQVDYVRVWQR